MNIGTPKSKPRVETAPLRAPRFVAPPQRTPVVEPEREKVPVEVTRGD